MASKLPTINLLKKEQSALDKFISWALTVGRVLVIFTEFVALGAFLYRFTLDQQLSDLHDQINNKAKILSLLKTNEDIFRNLQQRLALASSLSTQASYYTNIVNDIIALAPADIFIGRITISKAIIGLSISAASTSSLQTFINSLKTYQYTDSVSISNIQDQPSKGVIAVSISINLK